MICRVCLTWPIRERFGVSRPPFFLKYSGAREIAYRVFYKRALGVYLRRKKKHGIFSPRTLNHNTCRILGDWQGKQEPSMELPLKAYVWNRSKEDKDLNRSPEEAWEAVKLQKDFHFMEAYVRAFTTREHDGTYWSDYILLVDGKPSKGYYSSLFWNIMILEPRAMLEG